MQAGHAARIRQAIDRKCEVLVNREDLFVGRNHCIPVLGCLQRQGFLLERRDLFQSQALVDLEQAVGRLR